MNNIQRTLNLEGNIFYCYDDGTVEYIDSNGKLCRKKGTITTKGYRVIQKRINGIDKTFRIHRLIALAFHSKPDNYDQVDHINRIRDDNRPSNLRWVNAKMNADNNLKVYRSINKYGVRYCDDKNEYQRRYRKLKAF